MKKILLFSLVLFFSSRLAMSFPKMGETPQNVEDTFSPDGYKVKVEVWVENLKIPWSLIFLSKSRALVSERAGKIKLIKNGQLLQTPYAHIHVMHKGEGGLMGLAVHPEFPQKPYIYVMHTYGNGKDIKNRVIRLKDRGDNGIFDKVIIDNIPGARFHNGGRIAFGPDGMLYITTGENFDADLAQDLASRAGKILRVTPDGNIPVDNPFKSSPVYSYGHRNPQGLSWHPETKELFASEHGPSGEFLAFANDEINIIEKGSNYGWPEAIGAPGYKSFTDPLIVWKKTTPPSGITFYKGDKLSHLKGNLFVATLKSQSLIRITLKKKAGMSQDGITSQTRFTVTGIERWFAHDFERGKFGRIRDVVEGPDEFLYFLTNNTDGRGKPKRGDDKIYRIKPE
jgi:quinoprotein glucose dehydrogenase